MRELTIIGRAERVRFPEISKKYVPAKIDTGADMSSIWAETIKVENSRLHVIFFGKGSDLYTGEEHIFLAKDFSLTRIANSFGQRELRYKIKLRIMIKGRTISGSFTLSDRSSKLYPVLIGRSLLKNKFIVDVAKGNPLLVQEKERAEKLKTDLEGTDL